MLGPGDKAANVVKGDWFGQRVRAVMLTGKGLEGELTEVSEHYIILESDGVATQVMVHAIAVIRLAEGQ
jgi:sRNA-binding regulator protein Hfq